MKGIILALALVSTQLLANDFELDKFNNIQEIYHNDNAISYIKDRIGNAKSFDGEFVYDYFMKQHAASKGKIIKMDKLTTGELCFQGGCDGLIQFKNEEPIIIITYIDQVYVFFKGHLSNKNIEYIMLYLKPKIGSDPYRKDKTVMEIKFINQ
ncbi:hypothetical protein [uncultured Shewanella sp.]|uniref:hypothetical protein n=1 Tax=uncultured Shewanella sp. TaxID=173975 RepID=UPI00261C510B|nr:hypothetical protein [uncultured Shewanella sp.]